MTTAAAEAATVTLPCRAHHVIANAQSTLLICHLIHVTNGQFGYQPHFRYEVVALWGKTGAGLEARSAGSWTKRVCPSFKEEAGEPFLLH